MATLYHIYNPSTFKYVSSNYFNIQPANSTPINPTVDINFAYFSGATWVLSATPANYTTELNLNNQTLRTIAETDTFVSLRLLTGGTISLYNTSAFTNTFSLTNSGDVTTNSVKVNDGGFTGLTSGATTPVPTQGAGTIVFSNNRFFGWNGTMWKPLDN